MTVENRIDEALRNLIDDMENDLERDLTDTEIDQLVDQLLGDTVMNRQQNITFLTTNCDCWKGKDKVLANTEAFTDDDLNALREQHVLANGFRDVSIAVGAPGTLLVNELPAFIQQKIDAKKKGAVPPEEEEDEEDEEELMPKKKPIIPIANRLSPEELPVWNTAVRIEREARQRLTDQLTRIAAHSPPQRQLLITNKLKTNPTYEQLQEMLDLVGPTENSLGDVPTPLPNYFGAAGRPDTTVNTAAMDADADNVLPTPTLNFAKKKVS